jgi:hypothetical protein
MEQSELDAVRRREVFEEVCAEEMALIFPAPKAALQHTLMTMRSGDGYLCTDSSYTGRSIAQMARVGWACWKSASLIG